MSVKMSRKALTELLAEPDVGIVIICWKTMHNMLKTCDPVRKRRE
jgi:hypothetical protein